VSTSNKNAGSSGCLTYGPARSVRKYMPKPPHPLSGSKNPCAGSPVNGSVFPTTSFDIWLTSCQVFGGFALPEIEPAPK